MKALLVLVGLLAWAGVAHADAKKERELAAKTPNKRRLPLPGTKPVKLVNLYNGWTDEWLAIDPAVKPPQALVDRFLRDHFTNKATKMDARLIDILVAAAKNFRSETAVVVSGFRHPKYNLMLRKKGHQVARDSHHTLGDAVDFKIPNVATLQLHAWAKDQKRGGVGLYMDSEFVHMDTGKIRYWSGE